MSASVPEKLGSAYYRGFLTNQGKEFYDGILRQLLRKDYSGVCSFSVRETGSAASDCFAAYKALRDDHPEFFFLGFQSEFTRSGNTGTLRFPILYSENHIERIQNQLQKCLNHLVRGTASLPVLDREILVYERIARKLSYANHDDVRDHNIVGPVLLESGVCEGHNALLLLCLRRIDIPCIKVYGKTKSDGWHCWTMAWIHGRPVHCDVTWDNAKNGLVWFNYLNLSDRQISVDHSEFRGGLVPQCLSEDLTYYRHYGLCVRTPSDLRRQVCRRDRNGRPMLFHLEYPPRADDLLRDVQAAFQITRRTEPANIQIYPPLNNILIAGA